MAYTMLYVWVEGEKDLRFCEGVITPLLENKYDYVQILRLKKKEMKKEKVDSYLRSIISMGADYVLLGDIDDHPDEEDKKQELVRTYKKVDKRKIVVVVKEIESWYLAGLDKENSKKLRIPYLDNTDHITKEQFNNMRPSNFDSEIDFMVEIIKRFSIETAVKKNKSFKDFIERYCK